MQCENHSEAKDADEKIEGKEKERVEKQGEAGKDKETHIRVAAVEDNGEANAEDEEEVYGQPEARAPGTLNNPILPSAAEIAIHDRTHIPYRSWCRICVEAAGREDAHRAAAKDVKGESQDPTMSFE